MPLSQIFTAFHCAFSTAVRGLGRRAGTNRPDRIDSDSGSRSPPGTPNQRNSLGVFAVSWLCWLCYELALLTLRARVT